jgi:hypothetical protein
MVAELIKMMNFDSDINQGGCGLFAYHFIKIINIGTPVYLYNEGDTVLHDAEVRLFKKAPNHVGVKVGMDLLDCTGNINIQRMYFYEEDYTLEHLSILIKNRDLWADYNWEKFKEERKKIIYLKKWING